MRSTDHPDRRRNQRAPPREHQNFMERGGVSSRAKELPEHCSWRMSRVGSKNTDPEILVRKIAHRLGLRFRLHCDYLPGKPDVVFPKHKLALFVHSCFWHRHCNCSRATVPRTRTPYWEAKFKATSARDERALARLEAAGWSVLVIWECEAKSRNSVEAKLKSAIGGLSCVRD